MLIVLGTARALPGRREDLVAAAADIAAATRGDDGCLSYGFYAALDDADTIVSIETWRDQVALDAHMSHPHTQQFIARVGDLLDGTPRMAFHHVPDPS